MSRGTETQFELTTIERLERLGYGYLSGPDLARPHDEVVLREVLRASLAARYPDLPAASLDEAVGLIARPQGVDTLRRNLAALRLLRQGFHLRVRLADGREEDRHLYAIDWSHPANNTYMDSSRKPQVK